MFTSRYCQTQLSSCTQSPRQIQMEPRICHQTQLSSSDGRSLTESAWCILSNMMV